MLQDQAPARMELGPWAGDNTPAWLQTLILPTTPCISLFHRVLTPVLLLFVPGNQALHFAREAEPEEGKSRSCLAIMLPSLLRDAALKPSTTKPQVALPGDGCPSLTCRREGQELRHSTRTSRQNQKEGSVFHSRFSATTCGLGTQQCCSKEAYDYLLF